VILSEHVEQVAFRLTDGQISQIYHEYADWERSGILGSGTLLRKVSEDLFQEEEDVENVFSYHFERVAKRVFQEGTRRWIASKRERGND
jgi:hypothetical protein